MPDDEFEQALDKTIAKHGDLNAALAGTGDRPHLEYRGFRGSIEYSNDDGVFHGRILETADVVTYEAREREDLDTAFHGAVDDYRLMKPRRS